MDTVIIQPPLVQLNTPYPAGAYLSAFFRRTYAERHISGSVVWYDLSEALFHTVFCKEGLRQLFEASGDNALALAADAERRGDDNTAFQLRRYVSESGSWCGWIDRITAIVCSCSEFSGHEFVHEFVRSAHVPRGMRTEQYLSGLDRGPTADNAEVLASLALADLADYITAAYDKNFELVRYAESIAVSTGDFGSVERALRSPVLTAFYAPLLEKTLADVKEPALFCISVPFPGTLAAALFTAQYIKLRCSADAVVALGGGYVNTELRNVHETRLFRYVDFISYDRGYGSFLALLDAAGDKTVKDALDGRVFYKVRYMYGGKISNPSGMDADTFYCGEHADQSSDNHDSEILKYVHAENELTKELVPDYSDIDFSRYPHLADTANPMQRIWNDGAWMKVYLAYGCYWHRCAFCDTTLEYVRGYQMTDIERLYKGLREQARKTGVYGLHFVDEACPPSALQRFALLNCRKDSSPRFTYWGNIRFEKTFTRDLADLLSYGGMTGVSAGIEIATGSGLTAVNKGTDMKHIVGACCAFKEAGILVHSYMIYGYWNQSGQDLVDSMETLRQLFAADLIDSAFWHKFTLTRHSTVYREWEKGMHPDLHPLSGREDAFAENDVRFQGERKSERYSAALNASLESWMNGEKITDPVNSWFTFRMPEPSVKKNFINSLIAEYEKERDKSFADMNGGRFVWLGGKPVVLDSAGGKSQLCWSYTGDLLYADVDTSEAQRIADTLYGTRPEAAGQSAEAGIECAELAGIVGRKLFTELRGRGLCRLL
ncbi:MAG TPA: radical SAM protein [Treponema sp.]|nr:radical SAM protein [Treponema sp.]